MLQGKSAVSLTSAIFDNKSYIELNCSGSLVWENVFYVKYFKYPEHCSVFHGDKVDFAYEDYPAVDWCELGSRVLKAVIW